MRNEEQLQPLHRTNLILIGFMATGKTTVGRILAARTGLVFKDLDTVIVARSGLSIPEIFRNYGEARFRELEKKALKHTLRETGQVLATGGGVVEDGENMRLMRKKGLLVGLSAAPNVIEERTCREGGRPLLKVEEPRKKIRRLLRRRRSQYSSAAVTVDTSCLDPETVAERILHSLSKLVYHRAENQIDEGE